MARAGLADVVELREGKALETLEKADFRVDYIEIADAETLEPAREGAGAREGANAGAREVRDGGSCIALIAAFQGEVRLIDNMLL